MKKQELISTDGRSFQLFVSLVAIENPLGAVRAMLKEYTLVEKTPVEHTTVYKLHKTKYGHWFDHPQTETANPLLLMKLKTAIDEAEKTKRA
jgi:hypothetical protein